jgi:hypothetical protein
LTAREAEIERRELQLRQRERWLNITSSQQRNLQFTNTATTTMAGGLATIGEHIDQVCRCFYLL